MKYIQLLRPKEWVKNLFLLIPLFFAGEMFNTEKLLMLVPGFFAFSFVASTIYILNDYRDREDDRKHPTKCKRPLAAGLIQPAVALAIAALLLIAGFALAYMANPKMKFLFVLGIYFLLNVGYSLGLKNIPILDIVIIAVGFVFRVKGGSIITVVPISEWLIIMVFLLALFMAIGKRRDDVLLKLKSGTDMRKSIKGYNLDFFKREFVAGVCRHCGGVFHVHYEPRSNTTHGHLPLVLYLLVCAGGHTAVFANCICIGAFRFANPHFYRRSFFANMHGTLGCLVLLFGIP